MSTRKPRETLGHRMRTPLHTILGYVELMRLNANGEMAEQLAIVEDSARELLALVERIPEATRALPAPRETTTPAALAPVAAIDDTPGLMAQLPTDELEALRAMVRLGRLFQIEHWAGNLMTSHPEHSALAQSIITLARSANLPALENLLPPSEAVESPAACAPAPKP